ncbi:beta-L-arabinofuranosidase domain-containing protein (plasmid) [Spirosoma sp. SC4-14]|uniref:beta-L-arabinofuranosidase domain-containing protein n=1 Tax=Spirosoma sp. SC4-14 TaxID=3128900 RepID=UPI0030CE0364
MPVAQLKTVIPVVFLFLFTGAKAQVNNEVIRWLNQQKVAIYGRISQYDNQQYNLLTNQTRVALTADKQAARLLDADWQISTRMNWLSGKPGAADLTVTFRCTGGQLRQASVSVDVDVSGWSEKNYVLLPAAAYNGNRYAWRRLRYSPKLYEVQDIGPDKPIILTDVPKLSESGGFSRIQERSGSLSTPAVGFRSDSAQKGLWMLTQQGNSLGDYGINIAESRDRQKATISITSPIVRELYNYMNCDARHATWDQPKDFDKGDEVSITFRLYGFDAPDIQTVFDKLTTIRSDLSEPTRLNNTLTYAECMRTLEQKFNEKNFVPSSGYYAVGLRENFLQDWQIGWTGGMISTYPLLFAGNAQTRQHVLRNFDWLFPNGISPSGFYWDMGKDGTVWYGGDIRKPHTGNWHLIRKSGDAVYYIIKQFMLMEKMGIQVKAAWKEGNRTVCEALVKLWVKNHQFGQFVDSQTGEIRVGGSSSGAIIPAALALAAQYYQQPHYLDVARQAADYYDENFTRKGIACGGPGDALQNFDSESAYSLVESYVTLYEATGDKRWLDAGQRAARQFASWVVSYDFNFPTTSLFGKMGIRSAGAVYANTQNKHGAPAMCTFSGLGLLKLYRYTGDTLYTTLLRDIAHNMPQYLSHPTRLLGQQPPGFMNERVNLTDWEGLDRIGEVFPMTTWAETSLMLTTIEIPGLYVQPDKSYFVAFDNVQVLTKADTKKQLTLQLTNPTPVQAEVSVLEEGGKTIGMLGENALYGSRKVTLKPGESKIVTFTK